MVALLSVGTAIHAEEYSAEDVKAAFLFHFATYVNWPEGSSDAEAVSFAVLSSPRIAAKLARFAKGRSIEGRAVQVRALKSLREFDGDHVLFVGASSRERLARVLAEVDAPTLVVTDSPDGLPKGAMINFQLVDRRVRFEIALHEARRAGLALSSRLLAAAMRVETSHCERLCRLDPLLPEIAGREPSVRTSS